MPLHVRVRSVVADPLQRKRFHQLLEQIPRVVIRDGVPEPLDLRIGLIADQMFVTSETADRIDQHHCVIECSANLEAVVMSGAFSLAGPFSIGPDFSHPAAGLIRRQPEEHPSKFGNIELPV